MTKEEIIELARKANCGHETMDLKWICPDNLEAFAKLIAEKSKQEQGEPFGYLRQTSCSENPPHGWAFYFSSGEIPIYTKPQTKEWVELTREEKYSIYIECSNCFIREPTWEDFANAVEDKLKELNK